MWPLFFSRPKKNSSNECSGLNSGFTWFHCFPCPFPQLLAPRTVIVADTGDGIPMQSQAKA